MAFLRVPSRFLRAFRASARAASRGWSETPRALRGCRPAPRPERGAPIHHPGSFSLAGSIRRALALAAVVTALPLTAAAQVQPRPMGAELPGTRSMKPSDTARESVINWYGELQSISAHLQRVHDRALRDPALARARDQLMLAIQHAMDAADPELPRLAQRVERMPGEVQAARQRGDTDRLGMLERELAQIQARFMRVRADVLRQPEIARETRAYEERLRARMIQIEPLTENLLSRSGELQRLLQGAISPSPQED